MTRSAPRGWAVSTFVSSRFHPLARWNDRGWKALRFASFAGQARCEIRDSGGGEFRPNELLRHGCKSVSACFDWIRLLYHRKVRQGPRSLFPTAHFNAKPHKDFL